MADQNFLKKHGLGRREQFDERSRRFGVSEIVPADRALRSYTWRCTTQLNQGGDSSCVGCACAHELAARPVEVRRVKYEHALKIYHRAQTLDPWEGEDYDGTSVLAGVKALKALGYIREYRWAFNLNEILLTLGYRGPVILGVAWHNDMSSPDGQGFVKPTGSVVGGHAVLARAVNVRLGYVTIRNSWGPLWGAGGDCFITFDNLEKLLQENAEAVIPMRRARSKRVAR